MYGSIWNEKKSHIDIYEKKLLELRSQTSVYEATIKDLKVQNA